MKYFKMAFFAALGWKTGKFVYWLFGLVLYMVTATNQNDEDEKSGD